ncbi:MAG: FG-GAP repeat domain-containing protein [Candidatus Heimdallarchaeota archaeon]
MNGGQEDDKVIVGTVDGKLLAYSYDPVAGEVDLIWNSFSEDLWTMGRNIWAIQPMQGEGKIPTWMFMNETWEMINVTTDIPGEEFASMSYTHLSATLFEAAWGMVDPIYQDMFELNIPYHDLVIGTQRGNIRYFPGLTNYHRAPAFETAFFGLANAYYSNLEPFPYTSVAPAFANLVENPLEYPETMFVGYMSNDPTKAYDPAYPDGIATAGIHAWAGFPMFQYQYDLAEKELSGMLSRALETSQKVPRPYFADVDGDGDQDMIFTNGRIYYLENILNALWRLQPDYFADLNFNTRGYLFDGPQLYDFDADGDLDLAVGIRSTNKNGTTYYENKGTRTEPIWEEDKWLFANSDEEGNLAFNYHTDVLLKVDPETNLILNLTTYKSNGTAIGNFMADYKYHNSFILGTNPLLTRVEINLKAGETPALGEIRNYGYHVFETWDTEDELKEWTFSLSVGDLDDDGNKEVVVGSYDSNAYVFEHLTNNTYKRAYRSPDLTHQVTLAQSPYGSEQLEGLSGEFKRTFWDHVDVILAGMDLDGDGLQEFVAAADLSLFVFEATRTLGGYIQQDTYELIWQIDLRQSEWAPLMAFLGVTEVTALASGHDLNFNDRGEFVVAAGGFLFIFESWNDNDFREIFLTNTNPLLGRYGLPGNPLGSVLFSYTNIGYLLTFLRREINALAVGDTDGDKYPEILIGGTNNTLWGDEYGFLEVIESRVGSFELEWEAPLELTKLNPVLDIRLDDQDYDGHQDIIVGHVRGVDVWEYNGSQYVKQAIIPGSIKHPYYDMNPVLPIVLKLPITPRSHDVIQLTEDINSTYQKGDMIEAYGGFGRLWWSISKDNGATWTFKGQLIPDYIYPGSAVAETEPSLYFDSTTKNLWVIYRSLYLSSGGGTLEGIGYTRFGPGTSWSQFRILDWEDESTDNYDYHSPSVWAKPDSTYAGLGISYVHEDKTTTPSNFTVRLLNLTSGGFPFGVGGYIKTLRYIGLPGNTTLDSSNGTHSILTQDMVGLANGDYLLAFAGRQYDEYKLDTDIWAMQINAALDERRPTRVNAVGTEDLHPSVAQISNPGTNDYAGAVFLAFESIGDSPGNMLYGTYSRDNGLSWRAKEALPILPTFAAYATDYATGISVLVHKDFPFIWIRNYRVFAPAVAASSSAEGGYVFAFQAEYEFAPLGYLTGFITEAAIQGFYGSLLSQGGGAASYASMDTTTGQTAGVSTAPAHSYPPSTPGRTVGKNYDRGYWKNIFVGTNPDSIFTRYDHWEAEAISAGDSDGDGFREVAIASRYQAYDVELRNSLAPRTYVQQFQSPELGTFVVSENKTIRHRVTDIELYDSNGNGYAEIIVSTEGGNVYAFEIINTEAGQVDLQYFKDIRRDLSYSNTSVTLPLAILGAGNFTGDEYDDIVFSSLAKDNFQVFDEQLIFARDGRDGSILWNYSTSERKAVQNLVIDDFDGNGIDDLLFSANSTVFGLRGDTGTELWSPITGPVRVTSIGLFDAGGSPAFAFARDNNVSAHFIADGSLYWENSAPNGTIYMISSANLSNSSAGDDLVFVDITGDLWILNNTGQTQWINQTGFGIAAVSSSSVGLKDRVLFINSSHTMLLDSNGSIVSLLNRTHEASYASTTAEVLDLNGDGIEDVLIADGKYVSPVNIQAFDGMTGVLLWQYLQPEDDWPNPRVVGLTHMTIGFLAEDRPQIVVGTGYGAWFLDGRDGKPDGMFRTTTKFNSTNPYVVMGVSGNFGPLGTAALLLRNGTLIVVGPITHPTTYSLPLGIQTEAMWDPYRVPGAVSEIVIGDIDNDGIADDFVSGTSKKALVAFHGDTGDVLWKLRAKGPIRTMAAGDLDKDGHTDVVYGTTDGQLGAVLGASGVHLWTSYLVGMNIFDVEIVDHDDDGSLDVIVGAGSTITLTQGYVLIYPGFGNGSVDLPTKIDTIFTPVTKLFVGDFSNNGVANDIAALAILSGIYYIEKGVLFHKILDWVLSAVTGAFDPSEPDTDIAYLGLWNRTVLYSVKTGLINDWTVPYRLMLFGMASGDVDGDAVDEVFVRSMGHATYAYAVNTTGTPLWTFEEQAIFTTLYPALVDMNQDGTMDLLMKNYDTLFAIDGLTGTPVWAAFVTSDGIGGYAIGDLDTDGIPDIALGTSRGRVMVVEGIKNPNLNVGPIKPLHIENRLFADLAQFIEDNAHGYSLPLALLLLITVPVIVSFAIARHRRGALYRFGGAFA